MVSRVTALAVTVALAAIVAVAAATPLDDYVNKPDSTYAYKLVNQVKGPDYVTYNIFMTSQTWLTANDTNKPVWTHWLQVCVPDYPVHTTLGLLYIDGGGSANENGNAPDPDALVSIICGTSRVVAAHLTSIPNEPIVFTSDPTQASRSEDAIIAFTWEHFIFNKNDSFWLAHLPMTKASVRALDTMTSFVGSLGGKAIAPTQFIVAGASKRGWTTWLTGAVDKRVVGIVPIVSPFGNLVPQMNTMFQAYGNFSFALDDYMNAGCIHYLNTQSFVDLLAALDPLNYADRLVMPKLIVCDTGDEFFLPDSIDYMWSGLKGEKLFRVVPNAEHSLTGHQLEVADQVLSFVETMIYNHPRPQADWEISADGTTITYRHLSPQVLPTKVVMYHNHHPGPARDFRIIKCANFKDPKCIDVRLWLSQELVDQGNGVYIAQQVAPQVGYTGFFIEAEYNISLIALVDPFKVTSGVSILPQTLPYPPCGSNCAWPDPTADVERFE
ncbi:AprA [Capsaspora owczarzaki ATCC 30864]|uniref:AprA n=1 Tax=Capsaspora owczarzaki (strain ATCC 30864) TaxID=595528 RepID=A0A0D2X4A7_CAPO3|nr:AprA [Capsaspora owczarzaki ATCC 30864]KJE95729.1 AprA [Capsaspora owczarzaki ATCC 30864]|eukprot:XP_004345741.1 AprA [Capsaspora owczarzaki ATCC 30864]